MIFTASVVPAEVAPSSTTDRDQVGLFHFVSRVAEDQIGNDAVNLIGVGVAHANLSTCGAGVIAVEDRAGIHADEANASGSYSTWNRPLVLSVATMGTVMVC